MLPAEKGPTSRPAKSFIGVELVQWRFLGRQRFSLARSAFEDFDARGARNGFFVPKLFLG
jgi:hypothetical protein